MKRIRLLALRIENFKGIKLQSIVFGGADTAIYGENATGKTTIFDAWCWLLFDKCSDMRASFAVKPHDDGAEIHNLETHVEATVSIDGKHSRLSKRMTENWVKKRGQADARYEGNRNDYLIDGLPVKDSEWKAHIAALAGSEETFKMLSMPSYFAAGIKWEARRQALFGLIPDVNETDIVASDETYAPLREALADDGIDVLTKKLQYQIRELQKRQKEIPARIDELCKAQSFDDDDAALHAEQQVEYLKAELDSIDAQIADASKVSQRIAMLHQRKADLEREKETKIAAAREDALKDWRDGQRRYRQAAINSERIAADAERKRQQIQIIETELSQKTAMIVLQRAHAMKIFEERYQPGEDEGTCPVCRQAMPEDMLAERESRWQADKDKRFAEARAKGIAMADAIKRVESELATEKAALMSMEQEANNARLTLETLHAYCGEAPLVALEVDTRGQDNGIAVAAAELERLEQANNSALFDRKRSFSEALRRNQDALAEHRANTKNRARIAELESEERETAETIAALQKQLFLLESLTADKCRRSEEQINSLFPTVRWKLFDTQINGGLKECCECLIDGVPFPDANNAARINAGLEIIQVLGACYDLRAPVFVDNAESVNELLAIDAQLISLVVSHDKTLRIVVAKESEVA